MRRLPLLLTALGFLCVPRHALAQTLTGDALIHALQRGGCVLVMRHASAPRDAPAKAVANPDNPQMERQLDETGRATATAMGVAIRDLKIPVGRVLTSPTYRALQTVRLAQLPAPRVEAELGDVGQSMAGVTQAMSRWLQQQVTDLPPIGTNTILVTHLPNMAAAFPQDTAGLSDGEILVFGRESTGGATLVARIKIEQWSTMQP